MGKTAYTLRRALLGFGVLTALVAAIQLAAVTGVSAGSDPAPAELLFPRSSGTSGSALPERFCSDPSPSANCKQGDGFNMTDYEGFNKLDGKNDRSMWALDPSGSGKTVARFEVFGTDTADHYGGVRDNIWKKPADNCNGCTVWETLGFYVPVGFVYPDTWFLLYQNHGGTGNPAQAIELRYPPGGGSKRNYIYYKFQTSPTSGAKWYPLGPVQEGHWNYVLAQLHFAVGSGWGQVRYSRDTLPNPTAAPAVKVANINTLYPGFENSGFASLLLYRDPSSSSQHQIVYYCGFHRAADAATALKLANCPA